MKLLKAAPAALLLIVTPLLVSGCSRGEASVSARDTARLADNSDARTYAREERNGRDSGRGAGGYSRQREPVPSFNGRPMWSDNSRHTARENADYQFQRNGADLGAKTLDDFLTRVHAFVDHPPADALQTTRANGDRLLYDPQSNLFAVVRRDGAPRTVFKPPEKMAYWQAQQSGRRPGYGQGGGARADDGSYQRRSYARDDG